MFGYKIFGPNLTCYGDNYMETINTPYVYTKEHTFDKEKINVCDDDKKFYICQNPSDCLFLNNIIKFNENNLFNFIYTKVEIIGDYIIKNNFIICTKFKISEIINFIDFIKLLVLPIDNNKLKCTYIKNKLEGEFINKEKFIICNYKNNKKNGKFLKYYDSSFNKILFECNYLDDKLDGNFIKYDITGKIIKFCNYKLGVLNGYYSTNFELINYIKKPKTFIEKIFNNNKDEYKIIKYVIQEKGFFENGKKNGPFEKYEEFDNDILQLVAKYNYDILCEEKYKLYKNDILVEDKHIMYEYI